MSLIFEASASISLYRYYIYLRISVIYPFCSSAFFIIYCASFIYLAYSCISLFFYSIKLSPILDNFVTSLNFSAKAFILVLLTTISSTDLNLLLTEFIFYFNIFNSASFLSKGSLGKIASFITLESFYP